MKKLAFISLMALSLLGCVPQNTAKQAVIDAYHTDEVQLVPNFQGYFVVRDTNGAVWYVTVWQSDKANWNYVVKNAELVFKAKE